MALRPLPARLMNYYHGNVEHRTGFEVDLAAKPCNVPSHLLCSICRGIPREPTMLSRCGHLFCEICIIKWHQNRANQFDETAAPFRKFCPCPSCRDEFIWKVGMRTFGEWNYLTKQLYMGSMKVHCPYQCALDAEQASHIKPRLLAICPTFWDSPVNVYGHEMFQCPLRPVKCPNEGCNTVQPYYMIAGWHFQNCRQYRVFCPKGCGIPVRLHSKAKHDCLRSLRYAVLQLSGMVRLHGNKVPQCCLIGKPGEPVFKDRDMPLPNTQVDALERDTDTEEGDENEAPHEEEAGVQEDLFDHLERLWANSLVVMDSQREQDEAERATSGPFPLHIPPPSPQGREVAAARALQDISNGWILSHPPARMPSVSGAVSAQGNGAESGIDVIAGSHALPALVELIPAHPNLRTLRRQNAIVGDDSLPLPANQNAPASAASPPLDEEMRELLSHIH